MQDIQFSNAMTVNDTFSFPAINTERRRVIELFGVFGGATATIGYLSPSGAFVSFKASVGGVAVTATAEESWVAEIPSSGKLAIQLTGATGTTSLKLNVTEAAL